MYDAEHRMFIAVTNGQGVLIDRFEVAPPQYDGDDEELEFIDGVTGSVTLERLRRSQRSIIGDVLPKL